MSRMALLLFWQEIKKGETNETDSISSGGNVTDGWSELGGSERSDLHGRNHGQCMWKERALRRGTFSSIRRSSNLYDSHGLAAVLARNQKRRSE